MRAIPLARTARRRLKLGPPVLEAGGTLDARDTAAARRVAAQVNRARPEIGEAPRAAPPPVGAGDLVALAALDAVLHGVVRRERGRAHLDEAADRARAALGDRAAARVARAWAREFGPAGGARAAGSGATATPVAAASSDVPAELLVLAALNDNPAVDPVRELVDDRPLRARTAYAGLVSALERELAATASAATAPTRAGRTGPAGSLPERLREPMRRAPGSLQAQLRWVREHWSDLLAGDPDLAERVALALDVLAAWMPSVVLVAKATYVWLEQLSQRHGRWIRTLADVPDEELDRLADQGVTGLWLIGLWQRSAASAEIKRRRGDTDAVASAYSVDDYRIAEDLGGEPAYDDLRGRAMARGIRMAADMVPNHMGLDSRWVIDHPERFISLADSPFPAYSFGGPNLSPDPAVEIVIEDHYWDSSDAAVVFRRRQLGGPSAGEVRYVYHGNDGTSFPWNDTAQLDYLRADVREAVIRTILDVARRAPIIRFDAAMVLARRHVRRLWYPRPGEGGAIPSRAEHAMSDAEFGRRMPAEFWRDVVDRVAAEAPGTLLLAEAFWLLEGYFVRTLGMHRVYNSAFMHMLRDEDNAGYRRVIKDTLEFDPRVLQRFVNFMTNPDERPAAEQYGTGDKAFAVSTLLATLPGLPMLGHGQVDGLRERYGHEFRRARRDEPVDEAHAEHWQRTIVPILRRRAEFAGADRFHLYDAWRDDGTVDEDVFAFSNGMPGRHTLVVVHNRHADVDVTIDQSVAARRAGGGGRLARTRLADDLDLPEDETPVRFRDIRRAWETSRPGREVRDHGLRLPLGPYEALVLDVEVGPSTPATTAGEGADRLLTYDALATEILACPPRLGTVRLVAIDGPGGAGKSVLARRLSAALGGAPILETDDFASPDTPLEWWPRLEAEALAPLAAGRKARFERSRWLDGAPVEVREVEPRPVVLLEGVSSGREAVRERLSYLIWVDAPAERRLTRGVERDGESRRADWERWMADEDAFFATDDVRSRADLIVDGDPDVDHDPIRTLVRVS
jgi:hypothetical protein